MGNVKRVQTEEKPKGIIVFGILQIIFSSFSLLLMLFNLFILILALAVANIQEILGSSGVSLAHYIFSLIYSLTISILGLVAGIGILVLKPWARKLLLSLALIVIPVGTANLIFTSVKYTDLSLIMGLPGIEPGISSTSRKRRNH